MGGTSTDVSRYDQKQGYEHVTETVTAGVVVQCPQLDILPSLPAEGVTEILRRFQVIRKASSEPDRRVIEKAVS